MNFVLSDYNCWWTHFNTFIQHKTNFSSWKDIDNPDDFPIVLSDFLFSVHGSRFKINFQFSEELLCNKPAPNILVRSLNYKIHSYKISVRLQVQLTNMTGHIFVFHYYFLACRLPSLTSNTFHLMDQRSMCLLRTILTI